MGDVVGAGTVLEKTDASTSVNLPIHASSVAGDRVICGWTLNAATLPGTQSGFTTVEEIGSTGDTLAPAAWLGRKTLTGTDITNGYVTLASVPSAVGSGCALTYRDFDTVQDFTAVQLDKTATNSDFAFGAQTLAKPGVLVVYLCGQNTVQTGTFTPPSGFSEIGDRGGSGRNWTMGYRLFPWAGSSGAITPVSSQSTRGVGLLVGFRPNTDPSNQAHTI